MLFHHQYGFSSTASLKSDDSIEEESIESEIHFSSGSYSLPDIISKHGSDDDFT